MSQSCSSDKTVGVMEGAHDTGQITHAESASKEHKGFLGMML